MDLPELTNFGSLIRYALLLEASSASLYRTAAGWLAPGTQKDLARELSEQHESRRTLLERTRQQKLNEMVLEPISGLEGARYVFDADLASAADIRPKALGVEEAGARLYAESSLIAKSLLTEAARTLQKLAVENQRNLARLREAFPA
ncbi:MAG TPA: hypothetical protein VEY12_11940 [Thermoplasmata archaeon]|nr:hypothetical protein [Thermoplasmata archaeon]